ncbi:MAG: cysteine desulfurase family protein [Planctomycetota bacterium]|jgi:cysteine desulfurase
MTFVYLDYNATTPVLPEVVEAMHHALTEGFGNPSSPHIRGTQARKIVDEARTHVARLLGCSEEEVLFTSGGTESNNHAIKGVAHTLREKGRHLITSAIEHPAVEKVCRFLEGDGFETTFLPVDSSGLVDPASLDAAIRPDTILISVMHANNETGSIQPIAELSRIARRHGVLFHTDAAQSIGKIPARVDELGVDFLSLAGHKLYAPKGIGVLYVRKGIELTPLMHGAPHESGHRAGTENVPEIAGLGKACEMAFKELDHRSAHLRAMRDALHDSIRKNVPDVRLNGHDELRLPNTLSLSFPGLNSPQLIDSLTDLAVSAGSACHARGVEASHVLNAMGVPLEAALGTIRFSTGHFTTIEEVEYAADRVCKAVKALKGTG